MILVKILSNKLHDSVDDHFKLVSEEKYFRIRRDFSLRFMCLLTGSIRAISELRGALRRQARSSCKEISRYQCRLGSNWESLMEGGESPTPRHRLKPKLI